MTTRRKFITSSIISSAGVLANSCSGDLSVQGKVKPETTRNKRAIVIATWNHGKQSNQKSWQILEKGGSALDAVEEGVRVVESDPNGSTVGIGGTPDRDGFVTLDACIMDDSGSCGSVAFLQNIEHPISVARKVMEQTPHVMLVGEGAYQFAIEQGFPPKNLLTERARKNWENWIKTSEYKPVINVENHDTIAALAQDRNGNLSGACTTSGMAYKMHGRVGDSPIIGAGLFVDNDVGAACATGAGEAIIRVAGSAIVVEMMRQGKSPGEACEEAVDRIISKHKNLKDTQVGFLALSKDGSHGAFSVKPGFNYAVKTSSVDNLLDAKYKLA
ncbi:MAG: N(4)-(beta-N-acetylglucosaminyl)-L-asparaginase [Bacteroidota bacterium]